MTDQTQTDQLQTEDFSATGTTSEQGIAAVEASIDGAVPTKATKWQTSLWNYPATYLLMGINVAVYAAMFAYGPVPGLLRQGALSGVLTAPFDVDTLLRFGATASELVQRGEWWRLVTGAFVHVTLLHILLNMWCLWNLGVFGEPLLGKRGLVAVYLLTGTAGMLLSFAWSVLSGQPGLVAGASGAVFGIAGILIVLLSNRRLSVPWEELKKLRGQVILFAVLNLVLGMAPSVISMGPASPLSNYLPRIDNSAHLGGFVSGLALGLPLFAKMTAGKVAYRQRQRVTYVVAAFLLCLVTYALVKAA